MIHSILLIILSLFFVFSTRAIATTTTTFVSTSSSSSLDIPSVLTSLFKLLQITDVDVSKCVGDTQSSLLSLKNFKNEINSKNYSLAVDSLSSSLSSLSSSIGDCGVQEVTTKIDALAISIKFATIDTAGFDKAVKIVIGAIDLSNDIMQLFGAIESSNSQQIATAISTLMNDYTQVKGSCTSTQKGCLLIDGIIQIYKEVSNDIKPCEDQLSTIVTQFETAVVDWDKQDYKAAVSTIASALDAVANTLQNEVCGLKKVGDLIAKLSPKLAAAVVKGEGSNAVQIIVGSADVYDNLYHFIQSLKQKDYKTAGNALGNLLRELRASGCSTKACIVLEGMMASIQMELEDYDACMGLADKSWSDLNTAVQKIESKDYVAGAKSLGSALVELAHAVNACNIPDLAIIAEDTANKLGKSTLATQIGNIVSVLVDGADVTLDLNSAVVDFQSQNWASFGKDLGMLSQFLTKTQCTSIACQVVDGLLSKAGIAFQDLTECENDLKATENGFMTAAAHFKSKEYDVAVHLLGDALSSVSVAVKGCHLDKELAFIQQEANLFGLSNITSKAMADVQIIAHGIDFFAEIESVVNSMQTHDFKTAGESLKEVMDTLYGWTNKHVCTGGPCYVVVGVLQFLGDFDGSLAQCEGDFKGAFVDFQLAASNFTDSHQSNIFHFSHNQDAIKMGVKSLGDGMHLISKGVGDCHLQAFADLLEKLAVKLGVVPAVSWVEELIKILIDGVQIEDEIGIALDDFADDNWVGFGYNVAKLIKLLVAA